MREIIFLSSVQLYRRVYFFVDIFLLFCRELYGTCNYTFSGSLAGEELCYVYTIRALLQWKVLEAKNKCYRSEFSIIHTYILYIVYSCIMMIMCYCVFFAFYIYKIKQLEKSQECLSANSEKEHISRALDLVCTYRYTLVPLFPSPSNLPR